MDDYELENAQLWDEAPPAGRKASRATKKKSATTTTTTAATAANSRGLKQRANYPNPTQIESPLGSLVEVNGSSPQHAQSRSFGLQSASGQELSASPPPSSTAGSLRRDPVADQRFYTDPNYTKQPDSPGPQRYRGRETSVNVNRRLNQVYYNNPDAQSVIGHSVFAVPNIYTGVINGEADAPGEIVYEGLEGPMRDSDADRRAREGIRPDDHISLPARRPAEFDERFFGLRNNHLRHIAIKTGTHLSVPEDPNRPEIGIWGTPDQIEVAKRDLRALMDHIAREIEISQRRAGGAWEKVKAAPSELKQLYLDEQARNEWIRRKFRQAPPTDELFPFIGVFVWPMKELPPQQPLGKSFEALDDIRFENKVHITMARAQSMLRVLGSDHDSVAIAIERVFGVFCEIAARNRKPNRKLLVHPPSAHPTGTTVRLIMDHSLKDRQVTIKRLPENIGPQVALTAGPAKKKWLDAWKINGEKMEKANYAYLRKVVQQGLRDVLYFRGHVAMKVHFGTLQLFSYKMPIGEEYKLLEFCEMARHPNTASEVAKCIGGENVAKELIQECFIRSDLFQPAGTGEFVFKDEAYGTIMDECEPLDSGPHHHETTIEPAYYATLVCRTYDVKGCTNDIRLEVKFERIPGNHPADVVNDAGNLYKVGMRRWLQLPIGQGLPLKAGDHSTRQKGPFDIKMVDLENDIAWQFQLVTYNFTRDTDIYPIFAEFVRKLSIEEIPDQTDSIGAPSGSAPDRRRLVPRVSYVNLPGMTVEAITLKTKYQYWIKGTSYLFEVTKYEHFDTSEINALFPEGLQNSWRGIKTEHDTRWGAALQSSDWVSTLTRQKGLDVGLSGGWDPEVGAFFQSSKIGGFKHPEYTRRQQLFSEDVMDPWEGDGFKECISRIHELAKFIGDIKVRVGQHASKRVASGNFVGSEEFDE